jgi:hypothetical protein
VDSNQKPPGLLGGVHRVERAVPPSSPHQPKTAIRELRASDASPLGGRRCLDVPPTGYTARLNSDGLTALGAHLEPSAGEDE